MSEATLTSGSAELQADAFFARARARLNFDVPQVLTDPNLIPSRGDHELDQALREIAREKPLRPAAVLIPIVMRAAPTVILTQRSAHLADHPGQIAFPGGKIDAVDESPIAAALREAEEEIGLSRSFVAPIGYLDVYGTTFGFRILPVVAQVTPGFSLTVNRSEVDETFEVPLAFLMDPANHRQQTRAFRGIMRQFYAMPFGERYIWGATAGMLRRLYEKVAAP